MSRASLLIVGAALILALGVLDAGSSPASRKGIRHPRGATTTSACEGDRASLPDSIMVRLHNSAFPGADHPDAAVHIPKGFDATMRPGLVIYFHGWRNCVAAALAASDMPCDESGKALAAADLARQFDAAHVNALLVAIELRVDAPTGEPGRLAMPAGARELLRELFDGDLARALGCTLPIDGLDRIVLVAHSGGYQAAASVLARGDLPEITEVVLLDALYGARDVFERWIAGDVDRFDPRSRAGLRFVDLYTCCGGTSEPSRWMANASREALSRAGLPMAIYDDDHEDEIDAASLATPVVFKRVLRAHGELPRAYIRPIIEAAGFAPIRTLP